MPPPLQLRLRTSSGVLPLELPADASLGALRTEVAAAAALMPASLVLRAGYPPRALDLDGPGFVADLLRSGEVVAVQGEPDSRVTQSPSGAAISNARSLPMTTFGRTSGSDTARPGPGHGPKHESIAEMGTVVERVVPDDNSCLFRSVAGIIHNDQYGSTSDMRRVCSEAIAENPVLYTEDLLQQPNPRYCQWIQRPTSWGGPIELKILSEHFKVELAAYDIRSMRAERYSEGCFPTVGFLIYDGLHYNYLCLSIGEGVPDITQFDSKDPVIVEKVRDIVQRRHASGAFTDTNAFKLRCTRCGAITVGEKGAHAHGESTGHTGFEEVSSQK